MSAKLTLLGLALAMLPMMAGDAGAQMFGDRTLGRIAPPRTVTTTSGLGGFGSRQSSTNRASPGSGQSSGTAAEMFGFGAVAERHVRGARDASDFVGTDSRDIRGFVGMQQAENTGQVESAVSDLRIETGPDANRAGAASPRTRARMYDPRLKVGFGFAPRPTAEVSTHLTRRLQSSLALEGTGSIEMSQKGGTAILSGEVASERDRRLARLLLLLEPGISTVENRLTVRPPRSTPQDLRATPPSAARPENQR